MGCVFGKEIRSSRPPSGDLVVERERDKSLAVPSGRREKVVVGTVSKPEEGGGGEVQNGGQKVEEERKDENARRPRGGRRRSRPNPRLSNPPKHIYGEQVAAGWPSWLSAVAGEAINGWTPRRADSFEKIDKARSYWFSSFHFSKLLHYLISLYGLLCLWLDLGSRLDKVLIVMYIKLETP